MEKDQIEFFTLKQFSVFEYSVELKLRLDRSRNYKRDVDFVLLTKRKNKIINEQLNISLHYALKYYNEKVASIIEKVSKRKNWFNARMKKFCMV